MTKIAVFGLGYVGLAHAVFWAKWYDVLAIDRSPERLRDIECGNLVTQEPQLTQDLKARWKRFEFSSRRDANLQDCDFIFIATPTDFNPQTGVFETDDITKIIENCVAEAPSASVIIKSTVPIGYTQDLRGHFASTKIVHVPEFLREASAYGDLCDPSRIIIGDQGQEGERIAALYRAAYGDIGQRLGVGAPKIRFCGTKEAEAVKLFSNAYLATRLAFFNDLDSFAMANALDSHQIISGVCDDPRIGHFYNRPGFGFGGYCLPKDSKALQSRFHDASKTLISSVVDANERRLSQILSAIKDRGARRVGIYRLTMESSAVEWRASNIVDLLLSLKEQGLELCLYEPLLNQTHYEGIKVQNNFDVFEKSCDLIVSNRFVPQLEGVRAKLFTRDVMGMPQD